MNKDLKQVLVAALNGVPATANFSAEETDRAAINAMLKEIGIQARQDIEEFLGKQVFLETHVKTIEDWRDKDKYLIEFGLKEIE